MSTTRRIGGTFAAILALTLGGLLVTAGPAGAAESEGECFIHAVHEAEEQGLEGDELNELVEEEVLACTQAPSPILPETNEIIWGAVGFLVVFFFIAKFGLPQMRQAMNNRTEKIRGDIQAAEDQRSEADSVLAEYRAQLNDAKSEAGRIIEEARQAADQIKRDQEARLQSELAELRTRAIADIDGAKAQAMNDLRGEVAQLAIGAAETVVQRNLDPATQTQLVEDYINQVAAQRS
jgi:F-type H+-transporting ATPase subunit b